MLNHDIMVPSTTQLDLTQIAVVGAVALGVVAVVAVAMKADLHFEANFSDGSNIMFDLFSRG